MHTATRFDFPVSLEPAEEGGFVVTFPDVPEAITQGEDEDEALLRAVDVLETALEFYTDDGKDLPRPGKPRRGQHTVRPSALICVKLGVYEAMRDQGVRKAELARRMGWHMPQVDRLLDLHHKSRLDQAEETGIPYQGLIDLYLGDCVVHDREPDPSWRQECRQRPGTVRAAFDMTVNSWSWKTATIGPLSYRSNQTQHVLEECK